MKIVVLIFVISSIFSSCTPDVSKEYVILSGKIENPNSDTLNILDSKYELVRSVALRDGGTFTDTLNLIEGYYRLSDGVESTQTYLKPSFNLRFTLNAENFDESLIYYGIGANENNYLAQKALLVNGFGQLNYYGYYGKLSESDFLRLTDSLFDVQINFLNNTRDLDDEFTYIESKSLEFERLQKYSDFENMRRFVTGDKTFTVSDSFPDAFTNVDVSNEKLLMLPNYLQYLRSYLNGKYLETVDMNNARRDYYLDYLNIIKQEITSSLIKEELVYELGKTSLIATKYMDSLYNEVSVVLTNKKYQEVINQRYSKLRKIQKGAISPNFELVDINGDTVSLTDLSGKLVYIDIWATWCLPCKKEIPSLKKLEGHFKGKEVEFVSICILDTKEQWENTVLEMELKGIQLFAPNEEISFLKDYLVRGVPRFILIDEKGKIIDSKAKRPSDPRLMEEIEKYL